MNKKEHIVGVKIEADLAIEKVQQSAAMLKKQLDGKNFSAKTTVELNELIKQLTGEIKNFKRAADNPIGDTKDIKSAEGILKKIVSLYGDIEDIKQDIASNPAKFIEDKTAKKIKDAGAALKKYEKDQKDSATQRLSLIKQIAAEENRVNKAITAQKELEDERNALRKKLQNTVGDASQRKSKLTELEKNESSLSGNDKGLLKDLKRLDELNRKIITAKDNATRLDATLTATKDEKIKIETQINTGNLEVLKTELARLFDLSKDDLPNALTDLKNIVDNFESNSIKAVGDEAEIMGRNLEETKDSIKGMDNALENTANSAEDMARAADEVERLKNQVLDFFSIGNAVQLFKQGIREAYETVKELDAAMTEIAVVSDFTVGDMWERLPEFTKQANELGVSIKSTYDATALYIQQGLDLQHSMELSTETLRMARIAGMEAKDATDAMTAALRGFNMELNATSGQRVTDVYSELAAITASDVQEISTAMSKTASIAASANMEFESTAALLSQIIETTREAPETAGTALKTVIARFTEVKELQNKGELTGVDEEGEAIDLNKISAALRSVGISMNAFFAGTEGLDDVLLKLAQKWDTLDLTTQRYIATTAAGSRLNVNRLRLAA